MATLTWIEDSSRYIGAFVDELREAGHAVTMLHDCASALCRLEEIMRTSALVVVDLWLPTGMPPVVPEPYVSDVRARGLWFVNQLRVAAQKQSRRTPIVILSGNLDADTCDALLAEGVDKRFLWKKPANFSQFLSFLTSLLQGNSQM